MGTPRPALTAKGARLCAGRRGRSWLSSHLCHCPCPTPARHPAQGTVPADLRCPCSPQPLPSSLVPLPVHPSFAA